jgi:hypothetical protein
MTQNPRSFFSFRNDIGHEPLDSRSLKMAMQIFEGACRPSLLSNVTIEHGAAASGHGATDVCPANTKDWLPEESNAR